MEVAQKDIDALMKRVKELQSDTSSVQDYIFCSIRIFLEDLIRHFQATNLFEGEAIAFSRNVVDVDSYKLIPNEEYKWHLSSLKNVYLSVEYNCERNFIRKEVTFEFSDEELRLFSLQDIPDVKDKDKLRDFLLNPKS
jgi:hypothetical protein